MNPSLPPLRRILVIVVTITFVVTAVVLYITIYHPIIRERSDLVAKRDELLRQNRAMEQELAELKLNQQMFESDPAFVEFIARKEQNKARTNETVFVFER